MTPSYVTQSRTNTRRWVQQGGGEEDGQRRARRRDARTGEHGAAAARTMCAPIRQTILLSPHTRLVSGHITPPTGFILLSSQPSVVTVQRRAGRR